MFNQIAFYTVLITTLIFSTISHSLAQSDKTHEAISEAAHGLSLRGIGPALMGGRIADIKVSPTDPSTWYVAVGSGNLWKTTNSGITWQAIFDNQPSYSIGTVSIDPNNSEVIWVGTGENVSGRHVGWGDGIYKSNNGGKSWEKKGLHKSEHIGKILIDPTDSDVVLVAAEGPLWTAGGDRGVYRTSDGGNTWTQTLKIDDDTGVTDIEFHPTNPDIVYAAAYQRRRKVWSLLAGGPHSGIYKSVDGGQSWREIKNGLPKGDMGKIGLAVTPANPNIVYATIEADNTEKGFYRSTNAGESWEKRNSYISGGTGPHYYQEIEVSPTDANLIYQMDVFLHITRDGGKTFDYLGNGREKHSDNHALWIDPNNGKHLLAGTDAGLYESFDQGTTWRHFPNMPISQFYKLGLDNAEPYYNIVGGAQDLGTLIGPSRTMNVEGIRNRDWYVPLGADGYDSVFDPEDPNTVYMEIQGGLLHRYDRRSEEALNIQPQPAPNDAPERWNWDSPVTISPHNHERIYFGSQRVWRSDNRGNSWTAISGDLTTNTNRYELEMTDRVWSVDALYDNGAMSKYATLTSIAESPITEGILYTGSDDGVISITEDGGTTWRAGGNLPVPKRSFINDIEPSQHNASTVFAVVDAHKEGDYSPYLFMSADRGSTWQSISGDLPQGTIVWSLKQDYKDENLLFIGAENGVYFSYNKGGNWIKLSGSVPTIPFRDIELHERDNDLVGATFGRGFYVLDDYSALRDIKSAVNAKTHSLFSVRDAWWYVPYAPMQAKGMPTLGSTSYVADNPDFGATFTYYVHDLPKTTKDQRKEVEQKLRKEKKSVPFPGWDVLREESTEPKPQIMLLVKDAMGNPIRWIKGKSSKGLHRSTWDLRHPAPNPISLTQPAFKPPWAGDATGPMVGPGRYTVELHTLVDGELVQQGEHQSFQLKPLPSDDTGVNTDAVAEFQKKTSDLLKDISSAGRKISEANERIRYLDAAILQTPRAQSEHFSQLQELKKDVGLLQMRLYGDPAKRRLDESSLPGISNRVGQVAYGHWDTRQAPTETFRTNIQIAERDFVQFRKDLSTYYQKLESFESDLMKAGAPYTRGSKME